MRVDDAPIESPCDEDLDRMRLDPGGLARHCDRCSKSVHDLSAMGPERALALLAGTREAICISYVMDRRGELVFERPFVPLARLAQAATLVASLAACTPHGDDLAPRIQESAPLLEVREAPMVIPNQPPTPPKPAIEEPCEPEVEPQPRPERDRVPVKGRIKTAGVYKVPDLERPFDDL